MRKWYTYGILKLLVVSTLLCSMTGCGTLFSGTTQTVYFASTPQGATVEIVDHEGEVVHKATTPTEFDVPRGAFHVVKFRKEGHHSTEYALRGEFNQTSLWGNSAWIVLFPIGVVPYAVGMLVDQSTGAVFAFAEENVRVRLTRCKPGQDPHVVLAN